MTLETKIRAAASGVARDVKNAVASCKLDGTIAAEEKTIEELTREIGTLAIHTLDSGATMAPEIMERYDAVKAARDAIHTAKSEKRAVKVKAACPVCGAKTTAGMRFCGVCGACVEDPENAE